MPPFCTVYPIEDSLSPDGEPPTDPPTTSILINLSSPNSSNSSLQTSFAALGTIVLPDSEEEQKSPSDDRKVSREEVNERLDAWIARQANLTEVLHRLAESCPHLAAIMDKFAEKECALEDRAFSLFRRSLSSKKAQASKDKVVNLNIAAPESSLEPIIEESIE